MKRELRRLREARIQRAWARAATAATAGTTFSAVASMFIVPTMTYTDQPGSHPMTPLGVTLILVTIFGAIALIGCLVWLFNASQNFREWMDDYNDACERAITSS
jgi:hypothetical protein